jgi:hypothetical protein
MLKGKTVMRITVIILVVSMLIPMIGIPLIK